MAGDTPAQRGNAQGVGVSKPVAIQGRLGRLDDAGGGAGAGLPDFKMQHPFAQGLAFVGGAHHVHDDEGRHPPAIGCLQNHGFRLA